MENEILDNAYSTQCPTGAAIFYSNLGTQYTSSEFIFIESWYNSRRIHSSIEYLIR